MFLGKYQTIYDFGAGFVPVDNRIQTLFNHQPIKSSLINRFQNKIIHLLRSEKLGPIYVINTTRSVCEIRIT